MFPSHRFPSLALLLSYAVQTLSLPLFFSFSFFPNIWTHWKFDISFPTEHLGMTTYQPNSSWYTARTPRPTSRSELNEVSAWCGCKITITKRLTKTKKQLFPTLYKKKQNRQYHALVPLDTFPKCQPSAFVAVRDNYNPHSLPSPSPVAKPHQTSPWRLTHSQILTLNVLLHVQLNYFFYPQTSLRQFEGRNNTVLINEFYRLLLLAILSIRCCSPNSSQVAIMHEKVFDLLISWQAYGCKQCRIWNIKLFFEYMTIAEWLTKTDFLNPPQPGSQQCCVWEHDLSLGQDNNYIINLSSAFPLCVSHTHMQQLMFVVSHIETFKIRDNLSWHWLTDHWQPFHTFISL